MTNTWKVGRGTVSTGLLAMLVLGSPPRGQAQTDSTLIKVRATGVDSLSGSSRVFFSPGQEERATILRDLLLQADDYLAAQLGVQADFTLAVLDEAEWSDVWPFPYGLPYLSLGVPWTVVIPAAPYRSVLFSDFEGMLGAQRAAHMVDNIGFHEIGHVYVSEFVYAGRVVGTPPVRWLDEFLATYLAYAFLESVSPARTAIWDDFVAAATSGPRPTHTSLASFEAEYHGYLGSPEGTVNYSWYQAVFARQAAVIYESHGLEFIAHLRDQVLTTTPSAWTTELMLEALDAVAPGTSAWAAQLGAPAGGA